MEQMEGAAPEAGSRARVPTQASSEPRTFSYGAERMNPFASPGSFAGPTCTAARPPIFHPEVFGFELCFEPAVFGRS